MHMAYNFSFSGKRRRNSLRVSSVVYLCEWQEPCIAQCAQLQPQEVLPCFFCRIRYRTIRIMITIRTMQISIVARFAPIHCSIGDHSFLRECALGGGGPVICSICRACAILQIISFRLRAAGSGIPVAIVCIDVFIFYTITVDQALLTALLVSFVASL